jgi:RimJ/RimL family protein N-acetyltransferase
MQDNSRPKSYDISPLTNSQEDMWALMRLAECINNSKDVEQFSFFLRESPVKVFNRKDLYPVVILARYKSEVAGYAHLEGFGENPRKLHVARVGLYVKPEQRGNGLGELLLRELLERGKTFKKIWLTVYEDNLPARHLYEKCGFKIEGYFRNEELWGDDYRGVITMALFN